MAERWLNRFSRSEFKLIQNANASFKGVPFILTSSKVTFGRRLITHEFPQKDVPFTEDLGRRVRIFTVIGEILGPNYLTGKDNLAFVCEEEGVGELIDPFIGDLRVRCETIKFEDDISKVRRTVFEAVFIETGELTFPIGNPDTGSAVATQTDININNLKSPFEKIYDVASEPLVFTQGKLDSLNTAYDAIDNAKAIANIGPTFKRDLNAFKVASEGIVTSASKVFDSLIDLITFGIFDDEELNDDLDQTDSFRGLSNLLEYESGAVPESPGSLETDKLVQQAATITMALNTSRIAFRSANEAREFRNVILAKIDSIIFDGVSDEVTQDYNNLRAIVVQDIDTRSIELPTLRIIQPKRTLPAIVLAQELYGSAENGDDIIARNRIEHPGFVAGGDDLEILVDA